MNKKELKIPTLVGLLVVISGLLTGIWLVQRQITQSTKAALETAPKNLTVSNVSDNSATISWITDKASVGYVQYGEENNSVDLVVSDDRDQQKGSVESYFTHFVTIKGLKADTTYMYKVNSDSRSHDNDGKPFQLRTGPILSNPPAADVAYGQIVTSSGEPADGAIVYLKILGGNIQSALVKPSGSWVIPLSTVRNENLNEYVNYDKEATQVVIEVEAGPMGFSTVTTSTANDSPVNEIVLGQDVSEPVPTIAADGGTSVQDSKINEMSDLPTTENKSIKLVTPISGENVNSLRPEIIGTAPAGAEVTIEIHSETVVTGSAKANSRGQFSYSVPTDLPPGEHTVTISTVVNGVVQRVSRTFVVQAASDSNIPAFSATPSATLSPTLRPSRTPTPTNTPKPTTAPSATVTVTPRPTATPAPTKAPVNNDIPQSGNLDLTLITLVLGLSLIIGGGFWYQKSTND